MKRVTILAPIVLCLLASSGCKRDTAIEDKGAELEKLQQRLDEAVSELKAREGEQRAAELAVPTAAEIRTDLKSASAVLVLARGGTDDEDPEVAVALLGRARDVVAFVSARLPRAQTAVRLARAAAALAGAEHGEHVSPARAEAAARLEVAEAHAVCATQRSGALSADSGVTTRLKKILDAITNGDVEQAQGDIAALLRTDLAPSEDELALARADSCIDAAVEALGRDGRSAAAARAWIGDAQVALEEVIAGLEDKKPDHSEKTIPEPVASPEPPALAPAKEPEGPPPTEAPSGDATEESEPEAAPEEDAAEAESV